MGDLLHLSTPFGDLNTVDVVLVLVLVLYALDGIRRGFIAGALGLVGIVATVAVALRGYRPAAAFIAARWPMVPALAASLGGFLAVLVLALIVFAIISRLVLLALRPFRLLLGPLVPIEHALGVIPGLIQGMLVSALILTPLSVFPIAPPVAEAIDHSTLARLVTQRTAALLPRLESFAGEVASEDMRSRSHIVEADAEIHIPPQAELRPDPQAEAEMLVLLNAERIKAGRSSLVADERLRQVARQHSEEMFRLGYFSHESPKLGSPLDRITAAGIFVLGSGENLAYAPTVETAHQGLMASPGHRANILEPEFRRIGIGVISAGFYGRMFTQNFAF